MTTKTDLTKVREKVFELEEKVAYFERVVRATNETKSELISMIKKALSALEFGSDEEAREILEAAIKIDVAGEKTLTTIGEMEE